MPNGTLGDRLTLPLLALVLLAGPTATASSATNRYDYRLGVAVWFRSRFALGPDVTAMAHAPLVYQCHALPALALFALWPFGRLVHAFAVPLGYLTRPYVVYRSRGGAAPARRGARGVGVR
ncbi:respiratory nitrate reductase subunit gamma [Streptomyces mexicanus]|uniref:respiratory nitrate reductase subunit gamma n=1 Tax=Streptomyces mexicanus TaxID=178566 RepID=UPI0036A287FE